MGGKRELAMGWRGQQHILSLTQLPSGKDPGVLGDPGVLLVELLDKRVPAEVLTRTVLR